MVPWDEFRRRCRAGLAQAGCVERKSRAGRNPMDAIVMFKTLVLSALYNLSDDQIEYQVRDRLSFMRFLGLGLEDRVPDAKTVWLYREGLAQAKAGRGPVRPVRQASARPGLHLPGAGRSSMPPSCRCRRTATARGEQATIKTGEVPEAWETKPAKRRQKDVDARWTKKHGKSHFGYKNHVNVDRRHKLGRRYHVTMRPCTTARHWITLLIRSNTGSGEVWADAAYRSEEMEGKLADRKLKSQIHRKAQARQTAEEHGLASNRTKADPRASGGTCLRRIRPTTWAARWCARNRHLFAPSAKIFGMKNLAYNMRTPSSSCVA